MRRRMEHADQRRISEVAAKNEQLKSLVRAFTCCICEFTDSSDPAEIVEAAKTAPVVARCSQTHGLCVDCLDGALVTAAANSRTAVTCGVADCTGHFEDSQLCKASPDKYANYVRTKAEEEGAARAAEQRAREDQAAANSGNMLAIKDDIVVRAPCCGAKIIDFTHCCKVECSACPRTFCAWCFHVNDPGENGHAHLWDSCQINPEPRGLYADTPAKIKLLTAIWRSRQIEQVADRLDVSLADPKPDGVAAH